MFVVHLFGAKHHRTFFTTVLPPPPHPPTRRATTDDDDDDDDDDDYCDRDEVLEKHALLGNMCFVLCSPQGPQNVGSVARVMQNFGVYDLRIVNPGKGPSSSIHA